MDHVGITPTRCECCGYSIELKDAPGSGAVCSECGTLNTRDAMIRRAKRTEARQHAAVVVALYGMFHLFALIVMFRYSVALSLPLHSAFVIMLITILLCAGVAVRLVAGCAGRGYAEALIPAYFCVYLITLIFGVAESIVFVVAAGR